MQDCIQTLLQFTKISRFTSNLDFYIDEDPLYTEFPDINNPPGMRQIVRYVVAMLPSEKSFSNSIQRFVNSRKGKQECSINISMTGGIMGGCNGLLDLCYNTETPTLKGHANTGDYHDAGLEKRSSISAPNRTQDRIEYTLFEDNIVKLVTDMAHGL
jgi:hypothetical protein